VLFLTMAFIAASWWVTIRGWDAWPFSGFPMFSQPVKPEQLRIYRIALEYPDGTSLWWRPHYYKLGQTFGQEFARATSLPLRERIDFLHNLRLRIEHCLSNDPRAAEATAYCMVLRHIERRSGGTWNTVDEIVQRTALRSNAEAARELK